MFPWPTRLLAAALLIALAGLTGLGVLLGQILAAPRVVPELAPAVILTVPPRDPTPTLALPGPPWPSAIASPTRPAAATATPARTPVAGSEREAIRLASRAVVRVRVAGDQGTGFVAGRLRDEALVVTNGHVLGARAAAPITVIGPDGIEHQARPVRANLEVDLAVLAVGGLAWVEPLPLGDPGALRPGDPLYVIGYALGTDLLGDPSVTRGVLSGRRLLGTVDYVQTDAAMNPGNSGSPVIDASGRVVGVAVAGIHNRGGVPIQGINFAIPAGAVRQILAEAGV